MENVLTIVLNGERREVPGVGEAPVLTEVIASLGLKADRVAVERNGDIVRRGDWAATAVGEGDRLEVVHFVGGGSARAFRLCEALP